MIDNIDYPNASKVYKCERTNTCGVLQHVKDKSEHCTFHRSAKLYLEYYLGGVKDINYPFGNGEIGH